MLFRSLAVVASALATIEKTAEDQVARARMRMYDAYDRAAGDRDAKFAKMMDAVYQRIKVTKQEEKLEGIHAMLKEETALNKYAREYTAKELMALRKAMRSCAFALGWR